MDHDRAVEELYHELEVEVIYDDGSRWDAILREDEYFSVDEDDFHYDQPKGEFDVLLIDWSAEDMYYYEVKTQNSSASKGRRQIERAKDHFDGLGWDLEGEVWRPGKDI